jgi:hypothetical protein
LSVAKKAGGLHASLIKSGEIQILSFIEKQQMLHLNSSLNVMVFLVLLSIEEVVINGGAGNPKKSLLLIQSL